MTFFWQNKSQGKWDGLKPIDMAKIKTYPFPVTQHIQEEYSKKQIVLHHTVSGDGVDGDIESWEATPDRVATAFIVDRLGTPWQLFPSKLWAYHLKAGNELLDRHSIGIEIDSWGWLIPGDGTTKTFGNPPKQVNTIEGKYYTYYGNSVTVPMEHYLDGFRWYNYYEQYTEAQLRTIGELLLFFNAKYSIPLTYNQDMFDVSQRALSGTPGVWTHVSYRSANEKTDCHPQPSLIELLKSLEKQG
jgi:N-acetyl-anhydromuramyl-L-alanine amidase AmpD